MTEPARCADPWYVPRSAFGENDATRPGYTGDIAISPSVHTTTDAA